MFGSLHLRTQTVSFFSLTTFPITQQYHKVLGAGLQTETAADLHIGATQTVFIAPWAVKG